MTPFTDNTLNSASGVMISFSSLVPDEGPLGEMNIFSAEEGVSELYTLSDLYCPNPACDCCKVTLAIHNSQGEPVATIAYGWKSVGFYRKWGVDSTTAHLLTSGFLDPMGSQSKESPMFLKALRDMIKSDSGLRKTLKERYGIFKAATEYLEQMLLETGIADALKQYQDKTSMDANVIDFSKHKKSS
jgi:hypothetical protein